MFETRTFKPQSSADCVLAIAATERNRSWAICFAAPAVSNAGIAARLFPTRNFRHWSNAWKWDRTFDICKFYEVQRDEVVPDSKLEFTANTEAVLCGVL